MKRKEEENIDFFKKVWYSITKFEQYPAMAIEGLKKGIKYLIALTAIVTVFVMILTVLQIKTKVEDLAQYVQENIPDFSYTDGKLNMQIEEAVVIKELQNIGINRIVIDTLSETHEQKNEIEEKNSVSGTTIIFYKDEIVLKNKTDDDQTLRQPYAYSDFISSYIGDNIEKFDKTEFVNYLKSDKMLTFYARYAVAIFIYLLIVNVIVTLLEAVEIAILGLITATTARIRIRFSAIYNMAIYSLTLPMLLNLLYIIVNYFTGFTITYFQVAYITIAYIYLAAAIFILKDDFIKKMQEVESIKKEQLKVREEIKEQQEKREEDKKENKKEDDNDDEPQGSEA